MANKEFYKRIKIAGMVSYIPIMLAVGPFSGLFIGNYLRNKFKLPEYVLFISIGIGFAAGILEVIRIIRLVIRVNQEL